MTNTRIEAAQANLHATETAHAEAAANVTATAGRMAEVENAIRTGDARLGHADLIESDTAHRAAVLIEQGKAAAVDHARTDLATLHSLALRGDIEDGELGIHTDNLAGAREAFRLAVRDAAAKLSQATAEHNAGWYAAYDRLPETDHWNDYDRTGTRGSLIRYGKDAYGEAAISVLQQNGERVAITVRTASASVLERLASAGIYEGLHGEKPSWAV